MKKWFSLFLIMALTITMVGCTNNSKEELIDIYDAGELVANTMAERHDITCSISEMEEQYGHNTISQYLSSYSFKVASEHNKTFDAMYDVKTGEIKDKYIPKDFDTYILNKSKEVLDNIKDIVVEENEIVNNFTINEWKESSNKDDYLKSNDYTDDIEIKLNDLTKDEIISKVLEVTDKLEEANVHFFIGVKVNDTHYYFGNDKEEGKVTREKLERFYTKD